MIGLPDIVGVCGLASIEEIECGAVSFCPGVCQGHQPGIELFDDRIHTMIGGDMPPMLERYRTDLSVHKRHSWGRCAEGKPFNDLFEFGT